MDEPKNRSGAEDIDNLGLDGFSSVPDDDGLSLDALSEAYSGLVDGDDPYQSKVIRDPTDESESNAEFEDVQTDELSDSLVETEVLEVSPRSILEAMLFVGNSDNASLSSRQVAARMRGVSPREIDELVRDLNRIYTEEGTAYHIVSEGAGYRLILREEFNGLRERFFGRIRNARLSQAAVDILAIVAYNQPITSEEIDKLRSRSSTGLLSQLVRRELLCFDRSDGNSHNREYSTTDRFLRLFRLDSLGDLPQVQEPDRNL